MKLLISIALLVLGLGATAQFRPESYLGTTDNLIIVRNDLRVTHGVQFPHDTFPKNPVDTGSLAVKKDPVTGKDILYIFSKVSANVYAWGAVTSVPTIDTTLKITNGVLGVDISKMPFAKTASPPITVSPLGNIAIPASSSTANGYLTSANWVTFNGKQAAITFTTLGNVGPATFNGTALNIPVLDTAWFALYFTRRVDYYDVPIDSTLKIITVLGVNYLGINYAKAYKLTTTGSGAATLIGNTLNIPIASGSGDVVGPASSVDGEMTVFNSTTGKLIKRSTLTGGLLKSTSGIPAIATVGTDYSAGTSALATGILKSTTTTGALTTAVAGDFPTLNQNTTGTASNITGVLGATSHPALTGDITTPSGSVATTLATVNSNVGTFGSATQVPAITVNGKGLVTAVVNTTIAIAESAVTNLTTDLAAKADKLITFNNQTVSYTLVSGDAGQEVAISNASANNLTVPLNSSVAYAVGTVITITQTGPGQTTIVATGGVTINSPGGALKLRVQHSSATLRKTATDTWRLNGDLVL